MYKYWLAVCRTIPILYHDQCLLYTFFLFVCCCCCLSLICLMFIYRWRRGWWIDHPTETRELIHFLDSLLLLKARLVQSLLSIDFLTITGTPLTIPVSSMGPSSPIACPFFFQYFVQFLCIPEWRFCSRIDGRVGKQNGHYIFPSSAVLMLLIHFFSSNAFVLVISQLDDWGIEVSTALFIAPVTSDSRFFCQMCHYLNTK